MPAPASPAPQTRVSAPRRRRSPFCGGRARVFTRGLSADPLCSEKGPEPGVLGHGETLASGRRGGVREGPRKRERPAGRMRHFALRPQRRAPGPATATRPEPRSAESSAQVQRPLDPRAGPERAGASRPARVSGPPRGPGAKPGSVLQRPGRPQPLAAPASNSTPGLVCPPRGADGGAARERPPGRPPPAPPRAHLRLRLPDSPQPLLPQRAAEPQASSLPLTRLRKQSFAAARPATLPGEAGPTRGGRGL